ncbi:hypothetical protein HBB16_21040 [Pseudonocardia sp. MCCB 268]|nr:hypothetical protein [Pseudonocardia cytotoxica]
MACGFVRRSSNRHLCGPGGELPAVSPRLIWRRRSCARRGAAPAGRVTIDRLRPRAADRSSNWQPRRPSPVPDGWLTFAARPRTWSSPTLEPALG